MTEARTVAEPEVERLRLRHPGGETAIWAGTGALAAARSELASWVAGRTLFVVSTPQVLTLHGERLAPLRDAAAHLHLLEAAAGPELLARSYRAALEHGYLWHEFGDSHLVLP